MQNMEATQVHRNGKHEKLLLTYLKKLINGIVVVVLNPVL